MSAREELPPEVLEQYTHMRWIENVGWCGVHHLLFHWTMHYGITSVSYDGRYCYQTQLQAVSSMLHWDGTGDPEHWHKHPPTGRRRDVRTGVIWYESDIHPFIRKHLDDLLEGKNRD